MTLKLQPVPIDFVVQTWPFVEGFLRDAIEKDTPIPDWADNYDLTHVQGFLTSGMWTLIVATDEEGKIHGCCTVSFTNYPKNRVAFITLIGGKLISSKDTFEQLSNLLRFGGATKIQGMARPSVARLWRQFGFEQRTTLVEVRL